MSLTLDEQIIRYKQHVAKLEQQKRDKEEKRPTQKLYYW